MRILFLMRDDGFMTEPMNIMELSALAKQGRPDRSTHIAVIERDDIVSIAKELNPQVVASAAITGSHTQYLNASLPRLAVGGSSAAIRREYRNLLVNL